MQRILGRDENGEGVLESEGLGAGFCSGCGQLEASPFTRSVDKPVMAQLLNVSEIRSLPLVSAVESRRALK